jgi:small conductance mechanosensitive channel
MDMNVYLQKTIDWLLTSGLHIVLILILTLVALKATKALSNRLIDILTRQKEEPEFQKRTQTLGSIVRYALTVVIFIVALMTVLKEFGIEIGPILAAAGIVGLAIGFGAQSLVKDVISGFFIFLEDQIINGFILLSAGMKSSR